MAKQIDNKDNYWKDFWQVYPTSSGETDFLRQVGKTVQGIPISEKQFNIIVADVKSLLGLKSEDRILELCCGNGIITKEIAKECSFVLGIDFSRELIKKAKNFNASDNIRYVEMNARNIASLSGEYKEHFTKVLCYEALQFFDKMDFDRMLGELKNLCTDDPLLLFGSVLDESRKWKFFNTIKRKLIYFIKIRMLGQTQGLGRWWKKREIEDICIKHGFVAEFINQDSLLHTAHYRMDVLIKKVR